MEWNLQSNIAKIPFWQWGMLIIPIAGYDGFFGPGAGAFYLLGAVLLLKVSFLQAQVVSKAWNCASILGGLTYFIANGYATWHFVPLGIVNLFGGWVGSKIVLRYGNKLVRRLFIIVTTILIGRLVYQFLVK